MKIPISNALFENKFDYLKHFENKNIKKLTIQNLEFSSPDINKFTTLRLIPAMNNSKSGAIIINAANEIFVDEFLKKNIEFNDIFTYLNLVLKDRSYIKSSMMSSNNIKSIYKIDLWARELAYKIIKTKTKRTRNR